MPKMAKKQTTHPKIDVPRRSGVIMGPDLWVLVDLPKGCQRIFFYSFRSWAFFFEKKKQQPKQQSKRYT